MNATYTKKFVRGGLALLVAALFALLLIPGQAQASSYDSSTHVITIDGNTDKLDFDTGIAVNSSNPSDSWTIKNTSNFKMDITVVRSYVNRSGDVATDANPVVWKLGSSSVTNMTQSDVLTYTLAAGSSVNFSVSAADSSGWGSSYYIYGVYISAEAVVDGTTPFVKFDPAGCNLYRTTSADSDGAVEGLYADLRFKVANVDRLSRVYITCNKVDDDDLANYDTAYKSGDLYLYCGKLRFSGDNYSSAAWPAVDEDGYYTLRMVHPSIAQSTYSGGVDTTLLNYCQNNVFTIYYEDSDGTVYSDTVNLYAYSTPSPVKSLKSTGTSMKQTKISFSTTISEDLQYYYSGVEVWKNGKLYKTLGNNVTSFTDNVTYGATNKYKLRSFYKVGGETKYSDFTSEISGKSYTYTKTSSTAKPKANAKSYSGSVSAGSYKPYREIFVVKKITYSGSKLQVTGYFINTHLYSTKIRTKVTIKDGNGKTLGSTTVTSKNLGSKKNQKVTFTMKAKKVVDIPNTGIMYSTSTREV